MNLLGKYYVDFLTEVKEKIRQANLRASRAVNRELIDLYWELGKMIVSQQEKYGWGKSVVEKLAQDLKKEYPGIKGFSKANLWRMRNFYLTYKDDEKLAQLVREIGWSHNIVIMEKCENQMEREFYMRMAVKHGWSREILLNQIDNQTFYKYLSNQTNFDKTLPQAQVTKAKLAVKDEYIFDFLELSEQYSEKELEQELMKKVRAFLIEMGGYYTFIGNQFRLEVDGKEFFIDLLLYHRALRSLVAVELKIGEFKPEYAGKMQFYLSVLDDRYRLKGENPSIGIIVCKEKSRTIVEYTLQDVSKPIGVSTYRLHRSLPEEVKKYLPTPEQFAKIIEDIEEKKHKK